MTTNDKECKTEEEAYDQRGPMLGDSLGNIREDPLVFMNLEKQEEESAVQFFLRMFNIYQEIPSECKHLFSHLFNRMDKLRFSHDPQLLIPLKHINDELTTE